MAKHALKILRCEHRIILKICLAFYNIHESVNLKLVQIPKNPLEKISDEVSFSYK